MSARRLFHKLAPPPPKKSVATSIRPSGTSTHCKPVSVPPIGASQASFFFLRFVRFRHLPCQRHVAYLLIQMDFLTFSSFSPFGLVFPPGKTLRCMYLLSGQARSILKKQSNLRSTNRHCVRMRGPRNSEVRQEPYDTHPLSHREILLDALSQTIYFSSWRSWIMKKLWLQLPFSAFLPARPSPLT